MSGTLSAAYARVYGPHVPRRQVPGARFLVSGGLRARSG